MAGLEVVVRPVVFPNIRPAPARALAPEDNPDSGIATISGSGGRLIDLPHSWSSSVSDSATYEESKRVVDQERIYQVDENGNINKKNYVDVERAKASRFDKGEPSDSGNADQFTYIEPEPKDNVEILNSDIVITNFDKTTPVFRRGVKPE